MLDHDEDLEQRLRQKYSNGANVSGSSLSGPGTQAKYADDAGRGRSNGLAVHLCPVCNGEGKITSNYHGRILESTCEYCEGVGTFTTKNGVKITDEEATQIRREASLQAEGADDKADAKLEADIAKLEGMVKRYSEEVETLENAVSHSTGEKKELHEEVLGQVKIMLERSKGALNGKRNNWNKIREKIAREKQRALKEKIAQNLRDGARRKSHDKANKLPHEE